MCVRTPKAVTAVYALYPPLRCRSGCTTAPIRTVVAFSRWWCTVCPEDNPPCTPSRQTTVVPRLDGHQIDQVLFPMQASDGGAGVIATLEAGAGSILGASLLLSYTSPVILKSDIDITLSYYKVTPAWDGTTELDFISATLTSPEVVTTVYRHPTFLTGAEPMQLHERRRAIIAVEQQIAA